MLQTENLVRRALPRIAGRGGIAGLKLRARLAAAALRHRRDLAALATDPSPSLRRLADERPETLVGPLLWPYLCAAWEAPERLSRILSHYRAMDRLGAPFPFATQDKLVLAQLDDTHPGLSIVLDQPVWFMREGGLTLNLFVGDFRAYSLAFSLADTPDGLECRIGSIQGRNTDDAPEIYRALTKDAHGLRPRDFLLEVCRILCRHWGVVRLYGVRDEQRHHHHPYFAGKTIAPQDYDAIWEDRGGVPDGPHFYRLPIEPDRRPDAEIKPNKRSLYRRRYRFLDELETKIVADLPGVTPVQFKDR